MCIRDRPDTGHRETAKFNGSTTNPESQDQWDDDQVASVAQIGPILDQAVDADSGNRSEPVSYTHLDVYKRQIQDKMW